MTFLNPLILSAGLAAIAIPIAIHLLMRRRRKPTPWAAMRFLMEAMRRRRRRLQLERLILLAVRCLLVAAIALALGRPVVRGLSGDSPFGALPVTLAIAIDDSIASGAPDATGGQALDRHKAMALELLGSLRPDRGDRAVLVPLSGPLGSASDLAEGGALAPTSDVAAVGRLVEALVPTSAAADMGGAMALLAEQIGQAERAGRSGDGTRWVVAVLADAVEGSWSAEATRSMATLEDRAAGTGTAVRVLASDPQLSGLGPTTDIGIASLTPIRPVLVVGQGEAVAVSAPARVALGRSGSSLDSEQAVGIRLRYVDDNGPGPWASASARLRPGETAASVVLDAPVTGRPRGLAWLEAQIDPSLDGGVPGNDGAVAPLTLRRQLSAAIIASTPIALSGGLNPEDPAAWLRFALAPDALGEGDPLADIASTTLEPALVDAPRLSRVDVAFVLSPGGLRPAGWQALGAFARDGGLVLIFPEPGSSLAVWGDRATQALGLPWVLGPEAVEHEPALGLSKTASDDTLGLLRLVEGELEGLLRPVRVARSLPLAIEPGATGGALLTLSNGQPAALVGRPGTVSGTGGRGLVAVFAMPLAASWTDLPARPAVVPLVQELARAGVGLALDSAAAVAGDRPQAPGGAVQLRPGWTLAEGGSIAPVGVDADGLSARPLRQAGPWLALDGVSRPVGLVAVAPSHAGANRTRVDRTQTRSALAAGLGVTLASDSAVTWLDRPGGNLEGAAAPGVALALSEPSLAFGALLLLLALALAALEAVLARLFSHAQVAGDTSAPGTLAREAA
ncbi:MAG: BatA domain-containing protein [Phycisphaeraceae bacterium]|nr:BatA domain-containing protein [Phycisphaeraceae bacterium]